MNKKQSASSVRTNPKYGGITSEAVAAKTGRTWPEWVKTLDKAGCAKLSHKEIATIVHEQFSVPGWWSQMVTVGYEQAKGLREVHQTSAGYSASVSATIGVPVGELFRAWTDARRRARWCPVGLKLRNSTADKYARFDLPDGGILAVNFYEKGAAKSQVAAQHDKLGSAVEVAEFKATWKAALAALKTSLAT